VLSLLLPEKVLPVAPDERWRLCARTVENPGTPRLCCLRIESMRNRERYLRTLFYSGAVLFLF
jgi:hypothetical protein